MKWMLIWLHLSWMGPTLYDTEEGCKEVGKNAAIGLRVMFDKLSEKDTEHVCVPVSKEKNA
jgi:hypothetical protein